MMRILVLGDSHSTVFKGATSDRSIAFTNFMVTGASAQGSVNPHSKTNALQVFKQALEQYAVGHHACMVMLGEVDCGFVIWYRAKKYSVSVSSQLDRALRNYEQFLLEVVEQKFRPSEILICCVVPPVIKDSTDSRFLKGERASISTSQLERTKLTVKFNERIREMCNRRNYKFIDIYGLLVDKSTELVDDRFLSDNPYNHHLDETKTRNLWHKELKRQVLRPNKSFLKL